MLLHRVSHRASHRLHRMLRIPLYGVAFSEDIHCLQLRTDGKAWMFCKPTPKLIFRNFDVNDHVPTVPKLWYLGHFLVILGGSTFYQLEFITS